MPTFADMTTWLLLAQDNAKNAADNTMFGLPWWAPLPIIAILFYFIMFRPQQRERAKMKDMMANLKKNDRVVTIGGIVGSIVNAQQDSKYVTIKVDESSNAKIRMLRSAISRVVTDDDDLEDNEKKESL